LSNGIYLPKAKAAMMVGGIGWATRKYAPEPNVKEKEAVGSDETAKNAGERDGAMDQDDVPDTSGEVLEEMMPRRAKRGRGRPKRYIDDEDDKPEEEAMVNTESKGRPEQPASDIEDVQMSEERAATADPVPEASGAEPISTKHSPNLDKPADAKAESGGEADADGEADAEGEIDAQGEDDGEGSADIVDGVIGLEGTSLCPIVWSCEADVQISPMRMATLKVKLIQTRMARVKSKSRPTQSNKQYLPNHLVGSNSPMALFSATASKAQNNSHWSELLFLILH
jgi:hypothetical protein